MIKKVKKPHVWYKPISRLYASALDEKLFGLAYLKPIHELVDRTIFSGLEETLTPDFYRSLVKTAMEKAGYPLELSDEVSNLVAKYIENNFSNEMFFIGSRSEHKPSREELVKLFEENYGNITAMSKSLGTNRVAIYKLLKDHGINLKRLKTVNR
nr:hypothetical protein [Candidatus Woesearchaeota archaeon]